MGVSSIIIGVAGTVAIAIYFLVRRWRWNVAILKYCAARDAGKKPVIVKGLLWFKFREHWPAAPSPQEYEVGDFFAVDGKLVMVYRQRSRYSEYEEIED